MSDLMHCSKCGNDAEPLVILKGSTGMQLFLWCLIIPGFFYSLWRESSKKVVCSVCGSPDIATVCPVDEAGENCPSTLADENLAVESAQGGRKFRKMPEKKAGEDAIQSPAEFTKRRR